MTHTCKHHDGKGCTLGLLGGRPSPGACLHCDRYDGPSRGLGDTVKKVIDSATVGLVRKCGGCQKRREALNELFPKD